MRSKRAKELWRLATANADKYGKQNPKFARNTINFVPMLNHMYKQLKRAYQLLPRNRRQYAFDGDIHLNPNLRKQNV